MKLLPRDFRKLRWHLTAFAAMVIAAALLATGSRFLEQKSAADLAATASRHRQSEARLRLARTEEQEIKDKSALFQQLMATGVIGEEQRLDWTELLHQLQRQLRLPDMSYEFAPQAPLVGKGEGDYAFYASAMKLHLQLVHEEDLLNFLAGLRHGAKALVLVRGCSLKWTTGAGGQLGADCELDWITVRAAGEKGATQ